MIFTSDMKDLINLFNQHGVEYALVGGFAVNYYGYTRTTQDIDILINPNTNNSKKTVQALTDFGFGKEGVPLEYFEEEGTAIHLGIEPNRIDLLTSLKSITNKEIFSNVQTVTVRDISFKIIALKDLVKCKGSSARKKDQADAEELEKIHHD